jgi:hypothetical protein
MQAVANEGTTSTLLVGSAGHLASVFLARLHLSEPPILHLHPQLVLKLSRAVNKEWQHITKLQDY